ncbi:MAG: signal peptidase I [Pseudomonadota bacterium]
MTAENQKAKEEGGVWDTVKVIVQALILALILRTFLVQPFSIPSGSMKGTLLVGDYLFVSKYSYGYSQHSFPFGLAPISGRIWKGEPKRGDIAVFKLPKDGKTDYIKRIVGLPGDRVQMIDGALYLNGEAVEREKVQDFTETNRRGEQRAVTQYRETLPNGVSYLTLDLVPNGFSDNTQEYVVPEGHYFMMGDNRDNSADSRVLGQVGYVPYENLVGRAELLFFSLKEGTSAWQIWKWPTDLRFGRLFNGLRSNR